MNIYKEAILLGIQPIPPFARTATLVQLPQPWSSWNGAGDGIPFPAATSNLNVAALAFYPRLRMFAGTGKVAAMLGLSFWSDAQQNGVPNIYGTSRIAIPQGAEYFGVSWLQPPDAAFENGPYPEDLFRVVWGLGV